MVQPSTPSPLVKRRRKPHQGDSSREASAESNDELETGDSEDSAATPLYNEAAGTEDEDDLVMVEAPVVGLARGYHAGARAGARTAPAIDVDAGRMSEESAGRECSSS